MIKIKGEDINKLLGDKTNNLLLNLASGCLPEYLTKDEVELLKKRYGNDWFTELGYNESKYKKPVFD